MVQDQEVCVCVSIVQVDCYLVEGLCGVQSTRSAACNSTPLSEGCLAVSPPPLPCPPFPSSHQPSEGYGVLQTASGPLLVTNMTAYLHDGSRTVPHHHQQQQQQHSNATDRALRWDEGEGAGVGREGESKVGWRARVIWEGEGGEERRGGNGRCGERCGAVWCLFGVCACYALDALSWW